MVGKTVVSMVTMETISIVTIENTGISFRLSISRPLTIVISMVGIRISIVTMVGISVVGKTMVSMVTVESISIVAIKNTGISLWFSISRSLSIVVSMVSKGISIVSMVSKTMAIAIAKVVAISIVAIEDTSIGTGISLAGYCGKHAQSNYSNGFHHFQCLQ